MTGAAHTPESLRAALLAGQQFNGYATQAGAFLICLGSIDKCTVLARASHAEEADFIVDALRAYAGQQPALCRLAPEADDTAAIHRARTGEVG